MPQIQMSSELLIPKMQRDKLQADIATLKAAIKQEQQNKQFEQDIQRQKYDRKINELNRQIEEKRANNRVVVENLEKEVLMIK